MSSASLKIAPNRNPTYESEAAALTATRIPWASLTLGLAFAASGLIDYLYRPENLQTWLNTYLAQVAILGLPILFRNSLTRLGRFESVALFSWIATVCLMTVYTVVAPLPLSVSAYGLICTMTGASLLVSWKTTMQAILVTACCLCLSARVAFEGAVGLETTFMLFATFSAGLISIYGNYYFEIHRRAILSESLRSETEAAITSALEDFAKRLNLDLSDNGVENRVAELARTALKAEWVLVLVKENPGKTLNIVGGAGRFPTSLDNLKAIPIPIGGRPRLSNNEPTVRAVNDWNAEIGNLVNREWKSNVLLAPLCQRGEQIGLILTGRRDKSQQPRRLLLGIAQHAAIAIANSRLMDQLRRASTMKSEFLATMSHELRTPLHVIMGYTEMLGDILPDTGDTEVQQILSRLKQNEKSLTDLIEDTLDAHRLEAGRNVVRQIKFDTKALFEQIKLDTRWLFRAPGVQLLWDFPDESVRMNSDPNKVKVIAKNLIGNALKFTKQGAVQASARFDPIAKKVQIVISDSGPGIPESEIPHIFEMFRQATPAAAESALSGVGLGLFIVHEFTQQLGGSVSVENNPEGGARFTVEVPMEIPASADRNRLVA